MKEKCHLIPASGLNLVNKEVPPGSRIEKNNGGNQAVRSRSQVGFASCIDTRILTVAAKNQSDPLTPRLLGHMGGGRGGNGAGGIHRHPLECYPLWVWIILTKVHSQTTVWTPANTNTDTVRTNPQDALLSLLLLMDEVTTCQGMRHPEWIPVGPGVPGDDPGRTSVHLQNRRARVWEKDMASLQRPQWEENIKYVTTWQWGCLGSANPPVRTSVQGSATLVFGNFVSPCDWENVTELCPDPSNP